MAARPLNAVLLTLAALLLAPEAQARPARGQETKKAARAACRSDCGKPSKAKGKKAHGAQPVASAQAYAAPHAAAHHHPRGGAPSYSVYHAAYVPSGYYATSSPPPPPPPPSQPPPPPAAPAQRRSGYQHRTTVDLSLDIGGHNQQRPFGDFRLAIDGNRWGFTADIIPIGDPERSQNGDRYGLELLDLRLTYAIVSRPHLRVRLEGGLGSAFTDTLTVAGPDVGASLTLGRLNNVGLDVSSHVTAWPHTRVDATVGLSWIFLEIFQLRAGWKTIWHDDHALDDGTRRADLFSGPYGGFGLSF